MKNALVFAEITKSEVAEDGTLTVYGKVSDETLDIDRQIADRTWLKGALPEWFKWGNIREMHGANAVGIATEYESKDDGEYVKASVIDPLSKAKVEAGVLKGFSIGIARPRITMDKAAPGGRIVGGEIVEVSLVDRPANPACTLTIAKSATAGMEVDASDFDEATGLVRVEELVEDAEPVEQAEVAEVVDKAAKPKNDPDGDQPEDNAGDPDQDGDTTQGNDDTDEDDTDENPKPKAKAKVDKAVVADTPKAGSILTPEMVKTVLGTPEVRDLIAEIAKAATKATAEAFEQRLGVVEKAARPGGPARTRSQAENVSAIRNEKLTEAARYKAAAADSTDPILADGYLRLAAQAEQQAASPFLS